MLGAFRSSVGLLAVSLGLLLGGAVLTTRGADEDKAKPDKLLKMEELMEEVQTINKALIKHNRLNKAAFEAAGKTDEIAKDSEKLTELTKQIEAHAPKQDEAKKTKKHWVEAMEGVRKASKDMTKAAKEKNQTEFKAAFKRMDASCTKCHDVFRDE